ncbi:MAG: hypothetical protein DDG58_08195 [Ardenticatenia bacterium]|nr:MAG: hypothetical protein DDG58_08195 [Ardenticatenia bacterium]
MLRTGVVGYPRVLGGHSAGAAVSAALYGALIVVLFRCETGVNPGKGEDLPVSRKYRNPPVIEALCEFQFDPTSSWDLTVPGLVYEQLRDTFPQKRMTKVFRTHVTGSPVGVEQTVTAGELMHFLREDERACSSGAPSVGRQPSETLSNLAGIPALDPQRF